MRMSWMTDSGEAGVWTGVLKDSEGRAVFSAAEARSPPSRNHARLPINHAVTAGAAPLSVAATEAAAVLPGNCHNRRSAGMIPCSNTNATITQRNAVVPFGLRKAAHASSVQPRMEAAALIERLSVFHA